MRMICEFILSEIATAVMWFLEVHAPLRLRYPLFQSSNETAFQPSSIPLYSIPMSQTEASHVARPAQNKLLHRDINCPISQFSPAWQSSGSAAGIRLLSSLTTS